MGTKGIVANIHEGASNITVALKKPSLRYLDELLQCNCAPDLIEMKLFPNAKEITETFACYRAVRDIGDWVRVDNPEIVLISVGDGGTPRTAATFAYRSRWDCWSIDPALGDKTRWERIERLHCVKDKIEHWNVREQWGDEKIFGVVVVGVHSHAPLEAAVSLAKTLSTRVAAVAMPCCVRQELWKDPDEIYDDWGVWSPERTVKVWRRV